MNHQTARRSGAFLVLLAVLVLGITFAANADTQQFEAIHTLRQITTAASS